MDRIVFANYQSRELDAYKSLIPFYFPPDPTHEPVLPPAPAVAPAMPCTATDEKPDTTTEKPDTPPYNTEQKTPELTSQCDSTEKTVELNTSKSTVSE